MDDTFDLLVRGGQVFDAPSRTFQVADVGVSFGRIQRIAADLSSGAVPGSQEYPPSVGTSVVDAAGLFVSPGFVDMHAHVYTGVCPLTSPADWACLPAGVTTVISAGDAGANTIAGMRQLVVQRSMVRVLAFLHISSIGLSGWPVGESLDLDYLDVAAAVRAGRTHADLVVGVKVRMTETLTGKNGLIPLQRAVDAAQQLDVPVMVHIGGSDQALQTIVNELRPGDVITHCFTPTSNGVVRDGQLSEAARFGRAKGIAFDVGHGFGSFAFSVAEVCAESDFWPDVISTDLHGLSSNGPMVDLPTTMTKLLHLGMPLGQVVAAVTSEPARVVGRASEFGLVAVGREADLTLFELEDVPTRLADVEGQVRTASRRVTIRQTFRAGQPMNGPFQHPGVSYAQPPSVGPVVPAS